MCVCFLEGLISEVIVPLLRRALHCLYRIFVFVFTRDFDSRVHNTVCSNPVCCALYVLEFTLTRFSFLMRLTILAFTLVCTVDALRIGESLQCVSSLGSNSFFQHNAFVLTFNSFRVCRQDVWCVFAYLPAALSITLIKACIVLNPQSSRTR